MSTRTEKDSLGTKEVPVDAYYGIQTQRAVENFPITGMKPFPQLVDATVLVKKAAAEANRDLGRLPKEKADLIVKVADEILGGALRDQFVVDPIQAGAGTSHNMNSNEVIANRCAEIVGEARGVYKTVNPNDHVNMAQSTNDVFPTAMRVASLLALKDLYPVLDGVAAALQAKAEEFDGIVKSGRTHLQDAAPVRLGQEFGAYAQAIRRAKRGIEEAAQRVKVLGIGGTAVGTGLNAGPDYPKKVVDYLNKYTSLGFSNNSNLFEGMQNQTPILDLSAAIRTLAVTCIRIANDFRLLSSGPVTGLDEIRMPPVQPGSSIMPGKVNPVMAEMLDMACFQVVGNDTAVMMAAQAGQMELNVMMPGMAFAILFSIRTMTNALDVFTKFCIVGVTANPEKCLAYAQKNPIVATALNPIIGYAKAAELVKASLKTDRPVIDIAVEQGVASREELEKILDPKALTEPSGKGPAGG
ncbi:MAG TPA: aspartate ammonia-lyase [Armatimonadota bacterium]|jgi:aspartate ammonia-lyase